MIRSEFKPNKEEKERAGRKKRLQERQFQTGIKQYINLIIYLKI